MSRRRRKRSGVHVEQVPRGFVERFSLTVLPADEQTPEFWRAVWGVK